MADKQELMGTTTEERLLQAVSRLETQLEERDKTLTIILTNVEQLADKIDGINVKVERHISEDNNKFLDCKSKLSTEFVRKESLPELHRDLHNKSMRNNNTFIGVLNGVWKIILALGAIGS